MCKLCPRPTAHGPRPTAHGPWLTAHGPWLTAHGPWLTPQTNRISVKPAPEDLEITASELALELQRDGGVLLLDVREQHEWDICRIDGSKLVPLRTLPDALHELDTESDIVTICHRGMRSMRALEFLKASGFSNVRSLRGGVDAWAMEVDPGMPRY